jgi:membrane-associated protein
VVTGLQPLLFGIKWMEPEWLLEQFGTSFFWVSLVIIVIECGLFFPFLPGDSLLFAMGLFIAGGQIEVVPGGQVANLAFALAVLTVGGFAGNVLGYEIGRALGPPLYERDGRVLKRKYFDQTSAFFDQHGNKALVIGRFVPFVRTYITVVAGVTRMPRRRFFLWSAVGAVCWVFSITLLGYFLGQTFPWLKDNIDYAIFAILAFSVVPVAFEWWRHRRTSGPKADDNDHDGRPDIDISGRDVAPRRLNAERE